MAHSTPASPHWHRLALALIVGLYLVFGLSFSSGPLFESLSEHEHFFMVRRMIEVRGLPHPFERPISELHQPPLYYALAIPIVALADDSDYASIADRLNPFHGSAPYGLPGNDNKNTRLHTSREDFPYTRSGTALAVHLIRLLSIAFGAGTLLSAWAIYGLLWPDQPLRQLVGAAALALWPQFIFMTSLVNNDSLLICLATLSLYLLLRQLQRGPTWRGALILGLVLGAGLLTKANMVTLALPTGLAMLLDRRAWRYIPVVLGVVFLIAGWWYIRNIILYGEPTGMIQMLRISESHLLNREASLDIPYGVRRLTFAYATLWARFGYHTVFAPLVVYRVFDVLVALTAGGLLLLAALYGRSQRLALDTLQRRQVMVMGVFALGWVATLIYASSLATYGNEGRYLLPGIAVWGALAGLGLEAWTRPVSLLRFPLLAAYGVALLASAALSIFAAYLPAYRPEAAPASVAQPLALAFEGYAELIGSEPAVVSARPDQWVEVRLVWRAHRASETPLLSYLHSLDGGPVWRDTYPGMGNLLAGDWQPGQTWAETYHLYIPPDAETQRVYPLVAGLYDDSAQRTLVAAWNGQEVVPIVGHIAIHGAPQLIDTVYRFGDVIGLAEPEISWQGESLEVCLAWASLAPAAADVHRFVHLFDRSGSLIAQADAEPAQGRYPTRFWLPGEVIEDCVTLNADGLAPTAERVGIGLYDLLTGQRLPAVDAQGMRLDNDSVSIEIHAP